VLNKNQEYFDIAVTSNGLALQRVPKELQELNNYRLIIMAVQQTYSSYSHVHMALKVATKHLEFFNNCIKKCVQVNGAVYKYIDAEYVKTGGKELFLCALQTSPSVISNSFYSIVANMNNEENPSNWQREPSTMLYAYESACKIQDYVKREEEKREVLKFIQKTDQWKDNALLRLQISALDTCEQQINMWQQQAKVAVYCDCRIVCLK